MRENCLSFWREICRSRFCSQYTLFRTARNHSTSYQVRITHLNDCISYRSTTFAYRPLWIHFKFYSTIKVTIVITKSRCYYTPWRVSLPYKVTLRHKHTTYFCPSIVIKESYYLLDSQTFRVMPFRWKSCRLSTNWWVCKTNRWVPYLAHSLILRS